MAYKWKSPPEKGDKIERIEDSLNGELKEGQFYTVSRAYGENVQLEETGTSVWSLPLFKPITEKEAIYEIY